MAVVPMQRVSIFALQKHRKRLLELLQRRGVLEIDDSVEEDIVFHRMDTSSARAVFEKNISVLTGALEVLDVYAPEKGGMLSSLRGRRPFTLVEYEEAAKGAEESVRLAHRITALQKDIIEKTAELSRYATQKEGLVPWLKLDLPMRFKGTARTSAMIGTLPGLLEERTFSQRLNELLPDRSLYAEVVSAEKTQTRVFVLCCKDDTAAVEEALRTLGFARPAEPSKQPPTERWALLEQREQAARKAIDGAKEEIGRAADLRKELQFACDYYRMRVDKYEVLGRIAHSKHTFLVTGYIPKRDATALEHELAIRFDAAVELKTPDDKEDVPVALNNNAFAAPVEPVVEGYGMPGRGEVDPTTVTAVFYYLLFGMMLSDAGYGLVMVAVCGYLLHKFKNMESSLRKSIRMFFYCGFSTIFWGVLFGSYFGNVVDVVSETFFHTKISIPALWLTPVTESMQVLMISFLIGIIHIFAGLAMKAYQYLRDGHVWDAVCDVLFWYLLIGGGVLYLLAAPFFTEMVQLPFTLPGVVGNIALYCAGAGALGILFTAGHSSRSLGKRMLKGAYGLYNVTGYLSDILSYSRLLALGLATGEIAKVFNTMGTMAGDGAMGVVLFIFFFLVGHTINIGINLLGAYVHTNRLQYVEFFGKFYEGGGRRFRPFSANTQYYKILDSAQNVKQSSHPSRHPAVQSRKPAGGPV
jgi:V/A-type H+-transporting ATPase subunit I